MSKISEKISEIDEYDELDNSVYLGDNPVKFNYKMNKETQILQI